MAERASYLGQVRLARLQVVNWGTFCGYKDIWTRAGRTASFMRAWTSGTLANHSATRELANAGRLSAACASTASGP